MNQKLLRIAVKRELLLTRIAAQRRTLAREIEPWRMPLSLADHGLAALRYIRNNPAWMVGGVVLLGVLRTRNAGKWLGRALLSWQVLQQVRGTLRVSEITR